MKKSKSPKRVTMKKSKSPKRVTMKKSKSPKRVTKSPVRIDVSGLKKYSLTKYGYSSKKPIKDRHVALTKAVKKYGPHVVWRKLNLIGVLNKNRSPKTSNIFNKDKKWIKFNFIE